MSKILKQFFLEPEQVQKLEDESERLSNIEKEDVSQAEIVRRALEEYLK